MASVQASAAALPLASTAPPNGITPQQVQEVYNRFRQMKEQGVPASDPDFIKTQQFLVNIQQQQQFKRQMMQQQQTQQQAAQQAAAANGSAVNGSAPHTPAGRPAPGFPGVSRPLPPSGAAGTPATPTSAGGPSSATVPAGGPSAGPSAPGHFSPQQLNLLRAQIQAFKHLTRNAGVPMQTQQILFNQRSRRQNASVSEKQLLAGPNKAAAALASGAATPSSNKGAAASAGPAGTDVAKQGPNGVVSGSQELVATGPRIKEYKTVESPYESGSLKKTISYFDHGRRINRPVIPGILPTGIDFEALRTEREKIVFNRMSARYSELKSLPSNISYWDTATNTLTPDDTIKRKAYIEMKCLGLYSLQRALRDKIGKQMLHYDNLAMTTNRSNYRRLKKQSVREARITEKLEKQQRDAREHREKKRHTDFLAAVGQHRAEMQNNAVSQRNKMQKLGRIMYQQHFNIEKEEQKRIERTAKQRLQALKANDEEAYLKLLDQAKDTRITHLLRQTDGFLHQLASSVKAQQREAAERYGDERLRVEEESENESEDEDRARKIDYYAVAHRIQEEVTEQADMLVGGRLKEYQVKGLQWMISLYNNNLNGILADEMGLGKTIQTISLITYLIERKHQPGPFLVIVPLSTLTNWNLEFEKWAPSISRIVYKGPPNTRKVHQDKIRQGHFQVLLTTYEYVIKDRPLLSKIKWFHMIIDEGHRMKNANSKLSFTISQYYHTRFRLILTGTPLQNNLGELWAMLNFVLPNIFKSASTFDEWFNTPFANTGGQDRMELTEEEQILVIRRLHKVLQPFLLRRLKKDVEKDLPDKTEKVIKCKFSALQARLYKEMLTNNKLIVSDGKGGKLGARGLSNVIMQLRKLCNHPFVFDEIETVMNPLNVSNDLLWRTAGKFELLERVLPKYKASGHRVLMFFQMTAIMDIMEDFLRYRGMQYLRLDGTTKADERSDLLREFNAPDSPYFMFLLSTRAGGLGLNLQTADTVIIYDSDWNPHQDLQAQDRAHRIGQKNEVRILRLITSASIEEKILERARYKLDMDGKVIQAGRFDNKSSETDRDAMLRTLLETADMTETGDQEEMDDEELNMILARSDDELVMFQKMDEVRSRDETYGTAPGCKAVPRLMVDNELPDIYLADTSIVEEEVEVILGRGARERTKVHYDDGLTEEQWLMAVDDDEDSPEAAAARKQARKDKREANRLRRIANNEPVSPEGSRNSSEEPEAEPEPEPEPETPVKKRGRKPGSKMEKRKADDDGDEPAQPPPAKKRRGPLGRPKAVPGANGGADGATTPQVRGQLQETLRRLYDGLMTLEVDDPEPEDSEDKNDAEEEPAKRIIIGPFVKLPSKRDYGDYYMIIAKPICMNQINARIKKGEYHKLSDMQADIKLLCNNCRTYNDDGSLLYSDANTIETFFDARIAAELAAHADLQALEPGSSTKASSEVPSTANSTPAPANPLPKIKLVSNGVSLGASKASNGESAESKADED
ncbi:snf2-family atp dependent chromatin remodeling factor snf21 [Ophiostoma piceae UAMH 11346]|uniref:Snf2-family atp dependent chromatin remodeling factor snf21 n=1 Tax=Ophiostoma piceae (strain UAMH 11346) TaxID=1262450 RepID=S3D9F3_OPHP1|nr:snf2-family atp dependent chromatin remodeling factor snf21 [Ophiostoma piceae UAMH 11346]